MKYLRLKRDVRLQNEPVTLPKGTVVKVYTGLTYGCISPEGIAVERIETAPRTSVYPEPGVFFEIPRGSYEDVESFYYQNR